MKLHALLVGIVGCLLVAIPACSDSDSSGGGSGQGSESQGDSGESGEFSGPDTDSATSGGEGDSPEGGDLGGNMDAGELGDAEVICTPGAVSGCDGLTNELVCSADGTAYVATACAPGELCMDEGCTPSACVPGTAVCAGPSATRACLEDGSGYGADTPCDAGKVCVGGTCVSLCETDIKINSNVGCEYWSVDLDQDPTHHPAFPNQPTPEMFPHSVVVSNAGIHDATLEFTVFSRCSDGTSCSPSVETCGAEATVCDTETEEPYALDVGDPVVKAGESREFKMPVLNVSGSGIYRRAIRVMSSQPVVAYQFNPFDSENAASNDGSLLISSRALGKTYCAVSLPSRPEIADLQGNPWFPANNGFLAVVATAAGATTVTVTPSVDVIANPEAGVPQGGSAETSLLSGVPHSFTLRQFDVLNLEQLAKLELLPPGTKPKDLTGSWIQADKPIAVFSGHQVAGLQEDLKLQIPDVWDTCCTEHLEEQLMPVEAWGDQAFCVKSKPRGEEADQWIIVAGEANVTLSTTPSITGVDGVTLKSPGHFARVQTTESFALAATGKVQIVQFLVSAGQTQPIGGPPTTGDPSMMLIPPKRQYRNEYTILTAAGYSTNWATVIRPYGLPITLDGAPISSASFVGFGDGSWEYTYVQMETGVHTFSAEQDFGLMVYGYGSVTAYGYPGGMDLDF